VMPSPVTSVTLPLVRTSTRSSEFLVIRARAVILCVDAAGWLGLPHSGYLFGTHENPANSGDGYAMAYHAGARRIISLRA
jgi:succinate dehydrogenase/fumarate reductase flavoprotein subunit